jgi:hypothetical protein
MYIDEPYHGERELPKFCLREIDLPDIKYWEVGGSYYLVMKVEMTGVENMSDLPSKNDQKKLEGTFKVQSVRPVTHEPIDVKSLEKADFERTVADIKSGKA